MHSTPINALYSPLLVRDLLYIPIITLIFFSFSSVKIFTYSGLIPKSIPFCFPSEENGINFSLDIYVSFISWGISSKSPPIILSKLFKTFF